MDEVNTIMLQQIKEVDERDEAQILAELAGETLDEYIYETTDKRTGKRKVKLSWIGTREVARDKGNIALSDPIINDHDGFVRIIVRATDLKRNFTVFGGCHQPKQQKVKVFDKDGHEVGSQLQDDDYYFTKGLSKAQRNAIQSCIPAGYMAKTIDRFLLAAGRNPLKQLPKPKESKPRVARELPSVEPTSLASLHELETLAYNRWHIQPAEMYSQLGVNGKADCAQPPWECFLSLKEIYEP